MLGSIMSRVRTQASANPFSNPILLFALDLMLRMDRGEIDLDGLERVVRQLTAETFADRAERLRNYLGETAIAANERALADLLEKQGARGRFRGFSRGHFPSRLRRGLHRSSHVFDYAGLGAKPRRTGDRIRRSRASRSIRRDATSEWKRRRKWIIGRLPNCRLRSNMHG